MFNHSYTLAATGIKFRDRIFSTREAAQKAMYKEMGRYHLELHEVYDDKHFKTYLCNNNVRFYINREF